MSSWCMVERPSSPILLSIDEIPAWVIHLHKMISNGHGAAYRENDIISIATISPTLSEVGLFPYLKDVNEVWLVYSRRRM